jgi:hypothetical protein
MSRETLDVVKEKLQKNLDGAKDMVESEAWGCARIYTEIVEDLLDLVGSIRTDGDPVDGDGVSNVVRLVQGEAQ